MLSLCVWSLCSTTREAAISERPAHRHEEWPPLATTRESPRSHRNEDPTQPSINKLKKKKKSKSQIKAFPRLNDFSQGIVSSPSQEAFKKMLVNRKQ